MKNFTLTGAGINIGYDATDSVLAVEGENLRGNNQKFSGENLGIATSELGTMFTVKVLSSDRGGNQTRLSVLVPSDVESLDEGSDTWEGKITGAAIIITDQTRSVGTKHPSQVFDVRQLTGHVQNATTGLTL